MHRNSIIKDFFFLQSLKDFCCFKFSQNKILVLKNTAVIQFNFAI